VPPNPGLLILAVALAISVVTDLRQRRILNAVTYPALLLAAGGAVWLGGAALLGKALLGALICAGPLLIAMGRGWMGAGDVKLMAVAGLVAGATRGWPLPLTLLFDVAIAGGLQALLWMAAARVRRQEAPRHVPYAVAIAAGAAWAFLLGTPII
jgi:prepilin peptidase CpaA